MSRVDDREQIVKTGSDFNTAKIFAYYCLCKTAQTFELDCVSDVLS